MIYREIYSYRCLHVCSYIHVPEDFIALINWTSVTESRLGWYLQRDRTSYN